MSRSVKEIIEIRKRTKDLLLSGLADAEVIQKLQEEYHLRRDKARNYVRVAKALIQGIEIPPPGGNKRMLVLKPGDIISIDGMRYRLAGFSQHDPVFVRVSENGHKQSN